MHVYVCGRTSLEELYRDFTRSFVRGFTKSLSIEALQSPCSSEEPPASIGKKTKMCIFMWQVLSIRALHGLCKASRPFASGFTRGLCYGLCEALLYRSFARGFTSCFMKPLSIEALLGALLEASQSPSL